jgi:RNA polymerase sporulation-specific sigma factor
MRDEPANNGSYDRQQGRHSLPYEEMADEDIVEAAAADAEAAEFLLKKYANFARAKARPYFLIGADKEDIVQEGMIGLYKAIRDFRKDKNASFRAFAELCITRQIISAIKTATRQKQKPLNSYVSLSRLVYDEQSERTLVDILDGVVMSNPEDIFIDKEEFEIIEGEISSTLSALEKKVLTLYLRGNSYVQIAQRLGRSEKSVDNALQRAKGKIDKFLKIKDG